MPFTEIQHLLNMRTKSETRYGWQIWRLMGVVTLLVFSLLNPSWAQSRLTDRESKILELEEVNNNLSTAEQRQRELKRQIQALDRDVGAINRALVEGAKRGQELEDSITETEERLAVLVASQDKLRKSLLNKRALLGEVLAALQRMGLDDDEAASISEAQMESIIRAEMIVESGVMSKAELDKAAKNRKIQTPAERAKNKKAQEKKLKENKSNFLVHQFSFGLFRGI